MGAGYLRWGFLGDPGAARHRSLHHGARGGQVPPRHVVRDQHQAPHARLPHRLRSLQASRPAALRAPPQPTAPIPHDLVRTQDPARAEPEPAGRSDRSGERWPPQACACACGWVKCPTREPRLGTGSETLARTLRLPVDCAPPPHRPTAPLRHTCGGLPDDERRGGGAGVRRGGDGRRGRAGRGGAAAAWAPSSSPSRGRCGCSTSP
jgi:hypothetical protein